jgi:hypothetical protein
VANAPERTIAALSTNMKATVKVAGSLKPERPSAGDITPVATSTAAIISATRSMLSFSLMKSASATTTVPATIHWSGVKGMRAESSGPLPVKAIVQTGRAPERSGFTRW